MGPRKAGGLIVDYLRALGGVAAQPRYAAAFFILLILLGALFSALSGIILVSPLGFNETAEPLRIMMTALTAVLASANITVNIRNLEAGRLDSKGGRMTAVGMLAGAFTGACPLCQPAWLFWAGLGSVTGGLSAMSIFFGFAGIVFLLVALHYSLKSAMGACEVS
ncbi:MAG: hypothetical protein U0R44_06775 [Candidatus Micrarchaeia archaeon]